MSEKTTGKRILLAVALAGLLAACGSAEPVPEDHFYRLTASAPAAGRVLLPGTLEVERFIADGLTAGRPIVYSEAGTSHQVKEFHYHFWTEPPTVMLRDELVSVLRQAKVADVVVTPEMRVPPDHVLTGQIKRLEKVVGTPPKAVLELELVVRKQTGGKLVFLKNYRIETASDGSDVGAAVRALNEALTSVFSEFVGDLAKR